MEQTQVIRDLVEALDGARTQLIALRTSNSRDCPDGYAKLKPASPLPAPR